MRVWTSIVHPPNPSPTPNTSLGDVDQLFAQPEVSDKRTFHHLQHHMVGGKHGRTLVERFPHPTKLLDPTVNKRSTADDDSRRQPRIRHSPTRQVSKLHESREHSKIKGVITSLVVHFGQRKSMPTRVSWLLANTIS